MTSYPGSYVEFENLLRKYLTFPPKHQNNCNQIYLQKQGTFYFLQKTRCANMMKKRQTVQKLLDSIVKRCIIEPVVNESKKCVEYVILTTRKERNSYHTDIVALIHFLHVHVNVLHRNPQEGKDKYLRDAMHKFEKEFLSNSYDESKKQLERNRSKLEDCLSDEFMKELKELLPQIFKLKDFKPSERWIVEALNDFTESIRYLLNDSSFLSQKNLLEIIYSYKDQQKKMNQEPIETNFLNFMSFIKTYTKIYLNSKAEDLYNICSLSNSQKNFCNISSVELLELATTNNVDLTTSFGHLYQLATTTIAELEEVENGSEDLLKFEERKFDFQYERDVRRNFNAIKKAEEVPTELKYVKNLSIEETRKELIKIGIRLRTDPDCKKQTENNRELFVNLKNQLVVEYNHNNNTIFLKAVFFIEKKEFVKWVAVNIMFHKDLIVRKFKKFENACTGYFKKRSAFDYTDRAFGHENCTLWCKPGCKFANLTEYDLKVIVNRFMYREPFMISSSAGALHLLKHGGGDERLKVYRGEELHLFVRRYFGLASSLIKPEPQYPKGNTELDKKTRSEMTYNWVNNNWDFFKYQFNRAGNYTAQLGSWDGKNKATMAYVTIKPNGEIFLKSLIHDFPRKEEQASCFGWGKLWAEFRNSRNVN